MAAPLYDRFRTFGKEARISFSMPGHKGGRGLKMENPLQLDVTELPGTDNLHHPKEAIRASQKQLADFYGSDWSYYLTGGSTSGIHGMIASVCKHGDTIAIGRASHHSVMNICMLLGLKVILIPQDIIEPFCIPTPVCARRMEEALRQYPDVKAVLVTSPSYYGTCADLEKISAVTKRYQIPLLVDEAHGAHLKVSGKFPKQALDCGADMVVQSAHKTLNALTPAAFLHIKSDKRKMDQILAMVQTSSPSYLIVASAELAVQELKERGREQWEQTIAFCTETKIQIEQHTKIKLLSGSAQDPTRLVFHFSAYDTTGFAAAAWLEHRKIDVEMADLWNVVCIATPSNTEAEFQALYTSLITFAAGLKPREEEKRIPIKSGAVSVIDAQTVFDGEAESAVLESAEACLSARAIEAYPPGIPIIYPGERITQEQIAQISNLKKLGAEITGLEDFAVIKEQ